MRNNTEMMDLILKTAYSDQRIRAVIMNGSRTNPNVPKDCFQDYDIVYVVTDINSFISDYSWIDVFGKRIMLQMPETHQLQPPVGDGRFNYQMLFEDHNRIDLTLIPVSKYKDIMESDSLTKLLLDKDGGIGEFPISSDCDYYVTPPTERLFSDCCNDFWWVLQNVAKGICRDELPYAMRMFEYVRDMLDHMVSWHIGTKYDYKISTGKGGKYFKRYLSKEYWQMYCSTYSDSNYKNLWESIFSACELFRTLAADVAKHSGFVYSVKDDTKMSEYLKHMKELPADAKEI